MKHSTLGASIALIATAVMASPASALPSLQLGPGGDPGWSYDLATQTWVYNGTQPFTLNAYANATSADGGNGAYAWETEPNAGQYAYLVASAVPDLGDIGDIFTLNITNASLVTSGYGTAPLEDSNDLGPHGIFDTYFEIYEFRFDGALTTIENTEPPGGDPGQGYNEAFTISWSDDTGGSVTGLHFDLFTVAGDGIYAADGVINRNLVEAFAPFSHDAENTPPFDEDPPTVPEPNIAALMTMGFLSMAAARLRKRRRF